MKTKLINRIATAAVAVCVVLGLTVGEAEALATPLRLQSETESVSTGKSEVIYARLGATGDVENIYVVNRFSPQPEEVIYDFGNYSEVKPLSLQGSATLAENSAVAVETGDSTFFYQGLLEDKALPWNFELSYTLDGVAKTPAELSGAEGELVLTIRVTPNLTVRGSDAETNPWAKDAMLQLALTFPGDAVTTLSTEGGTVAEAGSNQTITFMVMPGAGESIFVTEATVQAFHMPAIQIAAVPFSMDLDSMFNASEFTENEDLQQLQDGSAQLAEGSNELADGLNQLAEAGTQLKDGLAQITEGGTALTAGSAELNSGLAQYTDGVSQLSNSSALLKDGASSSAAGAKELADGLAGANSGVKQYTDGVSAYVDGIAQLLSGIEGLSNGANQLAAGADSYNAGLAQLTGGGAELVSGSEELKAGLAGLSSMEPIDTTAITNLQASMNAFNPEDLQALQAGSTQLKNSLPELVNGLSGMKQLADATSQALTAIVDGIEQQLAAQSDPATLTETLGLSAEAMANPDVQKLLAYMGSQGQQTQTFLDALKQLYDPTVNPQAPIALLQEGLTGLQSGMTSLQTNYTAIDTGISQLVSGLTEVQASMADLPDFSALANLPTQMETFVTGYNSFHEGLVQYVNGVDQAAAGFRNESGEDLYSGIIGLRDGAKALQDGASQAQTGGAALKNTGELTAGLTQIQTGMADLASGLGELSTGISSYTSGVNDLAANGSAINSGLSSYTGGVGSLVSGLGEWESGFADYLSGLNETSSGAKELADGTTELAEGTATMDQQIEEMVNDLLAQYEGSGEPLPSFVSEQNTDVEQVQFVIMTQEIASPAEPEPVPEVETELTFWDRIRNLFR